MAVLGASEFRAEGVDYTINDPNNANEFSASVAYSAGQYVYYQGILYRFTADHAAGAWNSAHVTQAKLGQDVSDLKSAFIYPTSTKISVVQGYYAYATGLPGILQNYCRCDFLWNDCILKTTAMCMYLLAYTVDETYVGVWNGSTFATTGQTVLRSVNVHELLKQYPNYKFRLNFTNNTNTAITPADVLTDLNVKHYLEEQLNSYDIPSAKAQIEDNSYKVERISKQAEKTIEVDTGHSLTETGFVYGFLDTSTGEINENLPLRGFCSDMVSGEDLWKILNRTGGTGGIRLFIYDSDNTYLSYTTYGNVAQIVSFDSTKNYRIFLYPQSTGGNTDSTKETLNSLLDNVYVLSTITHHKTYTVAKDGTGMYSSIQEAIDAASDGDIIYIKAGQYTEAVVNTKQIHVIGQDKITTILSNSTGEYATPPLWTCQGIWENLTIRAIDAGNEPTLERIGFAVHLDTKWEYNTQRTCTFRNCFILSDWGDAIGSGIEKNCTIVLDNVRTYSAKGAGCKIHSTAGNSGYNSNIYITNCIFRSVAEGQHGLMIHTAGAEASEVNSINLHINNTAMTDYVIYTAPIVYDPLNYGNSSDVLNQLQQTN